MADWSQYATPDPEFMAAVAKSPPPQLPEVKSALEVDQEIIKAQKAFAEMLHKAVEAAGPREYGINLPTYQFVHEFLCII